MWWVNQNYICKYIDAIFSLFEHCDHHRFVREPFKLEESVRTVFCIPHHKSFKNRFIMIIIVLMHEYINIPWTLVMAKTVLLPPHFLTNLNQRTFYQQNSQSLCSAGRQAYGHFVGRGQWLPFLSVTNIVGGILCVGKGEIGTEFQASSQW